MASSAASLLLRGVPLLRVRGLRAAAFALPRRYTSSLLSDAEIHSPAAAASGSECEPTGSDGPPPLPSQKASPWTDLAEYQQWVNKEDDILKDIEPIRNFAKEILHSNRYTDGECLNAEDEKMVIEKLLHYHHNSDDKIGCGLNSIVVDRHPEFRHSRCLFVVRTNGSLMDFSYHKCLKAYIRDKYPSHAEKFILKHFK